MIRKQHIRRNTLRLGTFKPPLPQPVEKAPVSLLEAFTPVRTAAFGAGFLLRLWFRKQIVLNQHRPIGRAVFYKKLHMKVQYFLVRKKRAQRFIIKSAKTGHIGYGKYTYLHCAVCNLEINVEAPSRHFISRQGCPVYVSTSTPDNFKKIRWGCRPRPRSPCSAFILYPSSFSPLRAATGCRSGPCYRGPLPQPYAALRLFIHSFAGSKVTKDARFKTWRGGNRKSRTNSTGY